MGKNHIQRTQQNGTGPQNGNGRQNGGRQQNGKPKAPFKAQNPAQKQNGGNGLVSAQPLVDNPNTNEKAESRIASLGKMELSDVIETAAYEPDDAVRKSACELLLGRAPWALRSVAHRSPYDLPFPIPEPAPAERKTPAAEEQERRAASALRWLDQAMSHTDAADHLVKGSFFDFACFHAHQAAEMALKALSLFRSGAVDQTHDLEGMASAGGAHPAMVQQCKSLMKYYTSTRYPENGVGKKNREIDAAEAEKAVSKAESILAWADDTLKKLGLKEPEDS